MLRLWNAMDSLPHVDGLWVLLRFKNPETARFAPYEFLRYEDSSKFWLGAYQTGYTDGIYTDTDVLNNFDAWISMGEFAK